MNSTAYPQPNPTALERLAAVATHQRKMAIAGTLIDDLDRAELAKAYYDATGSEAAYVEWQELRGPDEERSIDPDWRPHLDVGWMLDAFRREVV